MKKFHWTSIENDKWDDISKYRQHWQDGEPWIGQTDKSNRKATTRSNSVFVSFVSFPLWNGGQKVRKSNISKNSRTAKKAKTMDKTIINKLCLKFAKSETFLAFLPFSASSAVTGSRPMTQNRFPPWTTSKSVSVVWKGMRWFHCRPKTAPVSVFSFVGKIEAKGETTVPYSFALRVSKSSRLMERRRSKKKVEGRWAQVCGRLCTLPWLWNDETKRSRSAQISTARSFRVAAGAQRWVDCERWAAVCANVWVVKRFSSLLQSIAVRAKSSFPDSGNFRKSKSNNSCWPGLGPARATKWNVTKFSNLNAGHFRQAELSNSGWDTNNRQKGSSRCWWTPASAAKLPFVWTTFAWTPQAKSRQTSRRQVCWWEEIFEKKHACNRTKKNTIPLRSTSHQLARIQIVKSQLSATFYCIRVTNEDLDLMQLLSKTTKHVTQIGDVDFVGGKPFIEMNF